MLVIILISSTHSIHATFFASCNFSPFCSSPHIVIGDCKLQKQEVIAPALVGGLLGISERCMGGSKAINGISIIVGTTGTLCRLLLAEQYKDVLPPLLFLTTYMLARTIKLPNNRHIEG